MRERRLVLAISAMAAASACLGQDSTKFASADTTYRYLREVGRVRAMVNTDNRETIPNLLQGENPAALAAEAKALNGYIQTVDNIDPTDVDPEAVQFKDSFKSIVAAYKSVCLDAAVLYKQVAAADAQPGARPLLHVKGGRLDLMINGTLAAMDSLLGVLDRVDKGANPGAAALQPLVDKLHADEDRLKAAHDSHHDLTAKLKTDFADRYQGTDWTAREILP
jgi:hypothetical protein